MGERVFVLHPHQDVFLAPAAMCIPVPDGVPTQRAVLAANMETALNLTWDAAPLAGERMLVIGAGVVGLLTASLLARIPAAQVTVVDIDPTRETLARRFGCGFAAPDAAPAEQELIVHASASEAGLRLALDVRRLRGAHHRGKLVSATRRPRVPLGEAFHARRLRLIATQVGAVAPADARPAQPCRAAGAGARAAGRRAIRRAAGRADAIRGYAARRCRASSRPAACATSSPMGRRNCFSNAQVD